MISWSSLWKLQFVYIFNFFNFCFLDIVVFTTLTRLQSIWMHDFCFVSVLTLCVTNVWRIKRQTDKSFHFKICGAAKNHNLIILHLSAMRGQKSRRRAVWRRRVSRVSVGWRSPSPLCRRTSTSSSSPARTWWGTPSDSDCYHHYTKPANQCTNQYCQHYTKAF